MSKRSFWRSVKFWGFGLLATAVVVITGGVFEFGWFGWYNPEEALEPIEIEAETKEEVEAADSTKIETDGSE